MKHIRFILSIAALILTASFQSAKANTYQGWANLNSQAQVDSFVASGYTAITRGLSISGADVTDISGLSSLTQVGTNYGITISNASIVDLSGIANISNSRYLNLYNLPQVTDLDDLAGYSQLNSITLSGMSNLGDVDTLALLSNLRTLYLSNNPALTDLTLLSNLNQIYTVQLQQLDNLTDASALGSMSGLRTLRVNYTPGLTNLDMLSGINQVTTVQLQQLDNLTDASALGSMAALRTLRINYTPGLTNLDMLSGINQVTTVELRQLDNLTDVSALGSMTALRTLRINYTPGLTNLDMLSGINQVTTVELQQLEDLTDASALGSMTGLRTLRLRYTRNITHLDAFAGLTQLTTLEVRSLYDLVNLDALSTLTGLTHLYLYDLDELTSLDPLQGLTNLTNLTVDSFQNLTDLDALSSLSGLRYLYLSSLDSVEDLDFLTGLTNLYQLRIHNLDQLSDLNTVSTLTGLRYLDLYNMDALDLSGGLAGPASLYHFQISQAPSLMTIGDISALIGLQNLYIYNAPQLQDLSGISGLNSLRNITLSQVGSLSDISALESLSGLQYLYIRHASEIAELPDLSGIPSLRYMNLEDLDNLVSLGPDFSAQNIRYLYLLGLPKLTDLDALDDLRWLYYLRIRNLGALQNLDFLSNVDRVYYDLHIQDNEQLTDFCGLYGLFSSNSISYNPNRLLITGNAANPTPEEIVLDCAPVNQPPVAEAGSSQIVECHFPTGAVVNLDGSGSSDPDPDDVLAFAWSANGQVIATTATIELELGLGDHVFILTVTDSYGESSSDSVIVTVRDTLEPMIIGPSNIIVGTDPASCDAVVSFEVVASDNCSATLAQTHGLPSGSAYPLGETINRFVATDAGGQQVAHEFTVTVVDNELPMIEGPADIDANTDPGTCGAVITYAVSASDNCGVSFEQTTGLPSGSEFPLGLTVNTFVATDPAGNESQHSFAVTVSDVEAPEITIEGPESGYVEAVDTGIVFSATIEEACELASATWIVRGFNNQELFSLPASFSGDPEFGYTIEDSFQFDTAGIYSITLAATDASGNSDETSTVAGDQEDLPAFVVIYDPSAGFVTGGGWISSPEGAFHPGIAELANVTGKASFGFVAKYKKGATTPTGNTEFKFKAGDLNFKSTEYEWLVVAGKRAQYKGRGTINGEGNFRFMLTAIDGHLEGGDGKDRLRMKIWNDAEGGVVYDNQHGTNDDANMDDTTILGKGNIVVHKAKK